jgi:hypothetical protein
MPIRAPLTKQTTSEQNRLAGLTPEERKLIEWLEKVEGRKLTEQEKNLAIAQAEMMGGL